MVNKTIIILFSLLIPLGCQTVKPRMSNNNHFSCEIVDSNIPASELRLYDSKLRSPASKIKFEKIREELSSIPDSTLIQGGKEYLAKLSKSFKEKISSLNLKIPIDMTLLAGIPDPIRRASPDVTYVIDIAFLYPNTADPQTIIPEIENAVLVANNIFNNSSVNARLRTVGTEAISLSDSKIDEIIMDNKDNANLRSDFLDIITSQLPRLRKSYGADLAYIIIPSETEESLCGFAKIRHLTTPKAFAAQFRAVGAVIMRENCPTGYILAHEIGHNLGLHHNRPDNNNPHIIKDIIHKNMPFVRGGRGYITRSRKKTIMGTSILPLTRIPHFSSSTRTITNDDGEEEIIGNADANASEALLYTIEDASNYSPTVIPENDN